MTYNNRHIRHVCGILFLLFLINPDAHRASAQVQPADRGEKAGSLPGEPSGSGLGHGTGDQGPISYKTTWYPGAPVEGQDGDWGLVGQDLSLGYPLRTGSVHSVIVTVAVRNRQIDTDAVLPDSHEPYPGELWNIHVGTMYRTPLDGGRMVGGGISLGSAGDHPFASRQDLYVNLNAMYRTPSGARNAWRFMLMYSPMGEISFPLPGVSYSYKPSDQLQADIGLPFLLRYRPTDKVKLEMWYMLIDTIRMKATCRIAEQVDAFISYDSLNEAYRLRDRTNDDDRFFLYNQRASIGLRLPANSWLMAELQGGYAFRRYSLIAERWGSTGTDRLDFDPGPFVSLGLSLRW